MPQLKQMGMSMEQMADVSSNMLNIENSIQAEMKAHLREWVTYLKHKLN